MKWVENALSGLFSKGRLYENLTPITNFIESWYSWKPVFLPDPIINGPSFDSADREFLADTVEKLLFSGC